ncbi:hypothetical protein PR048_006677 [Dryococelus australis]|uniref:Uncharacterized protein n=1 Tax=Dryococelus australis TaxID=614101 RepID=A0ABQ9IC95_9NEOP|nr:hypothetical protein PR048_006677 [Dryococelus australis]
MALRYQARWRIGYVLRSYSEGPGFESRSGHPDFSFPWWLQANAGVIPYHGPWPINFPTPTPSLMTSLSKRLLTNALVYVCGREVKYGTVLYHEMGTVLTHEGFFALCSSQDLETCNIRVIIRHQAKLQNAVYTRAGVGSPLVSAYIEESMEQRRNERAGGKGVRRVNLPTSGIVRHDSHIRNSGGNPAGDRTRFAYVIEVNMEPRRNGGREKREIPEKARRPRFPLAKVRLPGRGSSPRTAETCPVCYKLQTTFLERRMKDVASPFLVSALAGALFSSSVRLLSGWLCREISTPGARIPQVAVSMPINLTLFTIK